MLLIIVIQLLWNIICLGCPSNGVYIYIAHIILVYEGDYICSIILYMLCEF